MKERLQYLLGCVNKMDTYNADKINEYKTLIDETIIVLNAMISEHGNPILESLAVMGIKELNNELTVRMGNELLKKTPDKQKTDFLYSRSTVTMTITNIIMNM